MRHVKETEKELSHQLQLQREQYEAAIQRHLAFIDQVISPPGWDALESQSQKPSLCTPPVVLLEALGVCSSYKLLVPGCDGGFPFSSKGLPGGEREQALYQPLE